MVTPEKSIQGKIHMDRVGAASADRHGTRSTTYVEICKPATDSPRVGEVRTKIKRIIITRPVQVKK
jgi:hypothetical protein